jgi:hypothetical protein
MTLSVYDFKTKEHATPFLEETLSLSYSNCFLANCGETKDERML